MFLAELGFPKVGLRVPGALMFLSQSLNWYLVLQQSIFIVPDIAASSSGLRDHHTARLHVLHVVWHCQESPQCRIPEAEISPALVRWRAESQGPWTGMLPPGAPNPSTLNPPVS